MITISNQDKFTGRAEKVASGLVDTTDLTDSLEHNL